MKANILYWPTLQSPWNSKGYEMAKLFTNKFTHLSPVFRGAGLVLEGRHNADMIQFLIVVNTQRFKLRMDNFYLSAEMEYDGIVLESWSRWAAYGALHDPEMRNKMKPSTHCGVRDFEDYVRASKPRRCSLLNNLGMQCILPEDLQSLSDAVDSFSLMNYDISSPHNPGQKAFLCYAREIEQLVLITPAPGNTLSLKNEKHKPKLQWEKNSGEDFFLYIGDDPINHAVFSRRSSTRGAGISIWEVYRVLSEWKRRIIFNIDLGISKHKDCSVREHNLSVTESYAMKALNAASLTPLSVLCERRAETRKSSSLPTVSPIKFSHSDSLSASRSAAQECLSRTLHGGVVLLSSVLSTGLARALTYEEALEKPASPFLSDFDVNGILDSVIKFGSENPTIIAGGVTVLAVPLILSLVLNKPKSWGVESAKKAYAALGDDAKAQLLDIRATVEFRQVGSPDISGLSKKPASVVYKSEDKPGFLKKLSLKFKEPENTTLFILDNSICNFKHAIVTSTSSLIGFGTNVNLHLELYLCRLELEEPGKSVKIVRFDGNSELVAELVTVNGFKTAYAIKDGAEGPRGWMSSGLPWIPPKKALSLDLSDLSDTISGAFGEGSGALPVTFALSAAAGLGVLAFSEMETILQVLGSAALIQFGSKKLLFAEAILMDLSACKQEDRKQTLEQVDEFLTTKIAPKELGDELKDIGRALLPVPVTIKALPATTEASPEPAVADGAVQKAEAASQINSVPITEPKAESFSGFSRPLSPYPYITAHMVVAYGIKFSTGLGAEHMTAFLALQYPDLKPPTSPTPSKP
ncbi:hypothetical protein POTOM_008469 [Populus tomentosa]|uniref:Uncharacterized protein n=1 Tax=Populus tomentosa TaxID=118781 RepID=A0A8X8AHH3_POPTO|nr:hypothetical protein POTOM_008469 [Populus tomentosa]